MEIPSPTFAQTMSADAKGSTGPKTRKRSAVAKLAKTPVLRATEPSVAGDATFESAATEILEPLQSSLQAVIAAVPGRIERSTDLQRLLQLDPKLAWQVYKFSTATSPLPASSMLPGAVAMRRFCKQAAKKGVSRDACDRACDAFDGFERFVAERAGDRRAFNSMVGGGRNEGQATNLAHKKASFRAAAHFLGVQTDTIAITFLLHPSIEIPGSWDLATLVYKVGIRRLRPDARIMLADVGKAGPDVDKQQRADASRLEPIEPNGNPDSIATLLPPFCSHAGAETLLRHYGDRVVMELADSDVGTAGATDWAFGIVERNTTVRPGLGERVPFSAQISAAVETFIVDMFFHDSIDAEPSSKVLTFVGFGNAGDPHRAEQTRLNLNESVVSMGRGDTAANRSEIPRYSELIQYACGQLGWNPTAFRAFRCRVEYPVLGTSIDVHMDYPPATRP